MKKNQAQTRVTATKKVDTTELFAELKDKKAALEKKLANVATRPNAVTPVKSSKKKIIPTPKNQTTINFLPSGEKGIQQVQQQKAETVENKRQVGKKREIKEDEKLKSGERKQQVLKHDDNTSSDDSSSDSEMTEEKDRKNNQQVFQQINADRSARPKLQRSINNAKDDQIMADQNDNKIGDAPQRRIRHGFDQTTANKCIKTIGSHDFYTYKAIQDFNVDQVQQALNLPIFPKYQQPYLTAESQPKFCQVRNARLFENKANLVNKQPDELVLAQHPYANTFVKFENDTGIADAESFAKKTQEDLKPLLEGTMKEIFSPKFIGEHFKDYSRVAIFCQEYKRQILLAHQGANMCQVHYNYIEGLLYEKFLPSEHSRRVIPNPKVPTRQQMAECFSAAIQRRQRMQQAHQLAVVTNAAIDQGPEKQLKNAAQGQIHDVYYGKDFQNIPSKQKPGVSMCNENFAKDRNSSDMVESLNIAIGATNELKMLLSGVTCASALFATLISARPKLLEDHYESVASLMQQKCGLSFLHMRNVPVCFEGTLVFKNKGDAKLLAIDLRQPQLFQNVETVLIDTIDKPIMVDMVLEYSFNQDPAQITTAEAFEDAKILLGEMKRKDNKKVRLLLPLIVQFTMIDPDTNQTVLLTSNLDLSLDEKDKTKTDLSSLCIRDVTIKSELLSTKTMMTADSNGPITSQIDLASRGLAVTKLDHSHCFLAADALATWKKQKHGILELKELKEKVYQYSDKCLQVLVQQLLVKIDFTSLGFETKKQKDLAAAKLLRLQPHKLQFFVPCMAETLIAAEKKLKQLSTIVLGSSELLRHTLHCDRERKMKEMYRVTVLPSFNANLVKKVGRSVPKITNEKFNAIFAYYESKSSAPVQQAIKSNARAVAVEVLAKSGNATFVDEVMKSCRQMMDTLVREEEQRDDKFQIEDGKHHGLINYYMALQYFEDFQDMVSIDKFYAAAMTYAYFCRHGMLNKQMTAKQVQGDMSECLLDSFVQVRVLLQTSLQLKDHLYSSRVPCWPPFHTHTRDFCLAIQDKDDPELHRDTISAKSVIYVGSLTHYERVVDWLITGLYIMLKNNDKIMMSPELFHTVYANPRVMYNFATYIKVATQGFARFHTANKFFIAYMNSRAFDHLEDALSEKQAKDLQKRFNHMSETETFTKYMVQQNDAYLKKNPEELDLVRHLHSKIEKDVKLTLDQQSYADFSDDFIRHLENDRELSYPIWKFNQQRMKAAIEEVKQNNALKQQLQHKDKMKNAPRYDQQQKDQDA